MAIIWLSKQRIYAIRIIHCSKIFLFTSIVCFCLPIRSLDAKHQQEKFTVSLGTNIESAASMMSTKRSSQKTQIKSLPDFLAPMFRISPYQNPKTPKWKYLKFPPVPLQLRHTPKTKVRIYETLNSKLMKCYFNWSRKGSANSAKCYHKKPSAFRVKVS